MSDDKTAALALAGGAIRRLGGADKPLLAVGGRSMLESVIAALEVWPIAISANGDPAGFAGFGLPVLGDGRILAQGPLAGILAGLEWATAPGKTALLTAPGDTPFVPLGLAAWLAPRPRCVTSVGRRHHLVALWPVHRAGLLRVVLSVPGSRRVAGSLNALECCTREFAMRMGDPFVKFNTYDDLANARARARQSDGSIPEGIDPAKG